VGEGRGIDDGLRRPGRTARRVITALVVLAVLAASGIAVALSSPALLRGLGLGEASAGVPAPPAPQPVLGPLPPSAPRPTPEGVAGVLDELAAELPGDWGGVVLDAADGSRLWERSLHDALVPGSTVKIITAAAALLTLDGTDVFVTRAVAGPEPGTVVLVGGGDPTLTTTGEGEDGVYPDAPRLADLAREVREAAGAPVTRVLVDTGRWGNGPGLAEGWDPADIEGGFIAPIVPLMVDGGRVDAAEQDGERVRQPALAAGREFARLLDVDPAAVAEGTAGPGATPLGSVSSAPVAELVEHMLRTSDNVLAEALARETALARDAEPTFQGSADAVVAALTQAGFDTGAVVLHDGSGLSTEDRVPVRLLGELLAAAAAPAEGPRDREYLRPIIAGLPVAGGDGTLDERFAADGASAGGRGVVRAKTGTLTGVSSLAGVVTTADGRLLVFSFASNGGSPAAVRPRLDALAAELSRCGCR
jgi:serine-type D-Ala-D-Ala carboxypeptidase/endopeptidase (penicillin-binding protein 4)